MTQREEAALGPGAPGGMVRSNTLGDELRASDDHQLPGTLEFEASEPVAEKPWFKEQYKSQKEMLDDEKIDAMKQMKMNVTQRDILKDPIKYKLPEKKGDLKDIDRDLRKLKIGLLRMDSSDSRKLAKLSILKHYDLLTAIYKKYCKLGGDKHWMTFNGWILLMKHCRWIKSKEDKDRVAQLCVEIFDDTYQYHHAKQHIYDGANGKHVAYLSGMYGDGQFHDINPWTGVWCLQEDKERIDGILKMKVERKKSFISGAGSKGKIKEEEDKKKRATSYETYKFRKYGDIRVMGCYEHPIDKSEADIGGGLNKKDHKKAKLEIRFKTRSVQGHHQRRMFNCTISPPEDEESPITMTVKWKEVDNKGSGTIELFKLKGLDDEDSALPATEYTGLARHEFFDAMLLLASVVNNNEDGDLNDLYKMMDEVACHTLTDYVYNGIIETRKHIRDGKLHDDIRKKFKKNYTSIRHLFDKFASLVHTEEVPTKTTVKAANITDLGEDQWLAMAMELCEVPKTKTKKFWKRGGKPDTQTLVDCFMLSHDSSMLTVEEIEWQEFQRCLVYFIVEMFKDVPDAKYKVLPFDEKLDMVLDWADTLDAKKTTMGGGSMIRCDKFVAMKTLRDKEDLLCSAGSPINGTMFGNNKEAMKKYHTLREAHAPTELSPKLLDIQGIDEWDDDGMDDELDFKNLKNPSSGPGDDDLIGALF